MGMTLSLPLPLPPWISPLVWEDSNKTVLPANIFPPPRVALAGGARAQAQSTHRPHWLVCTHKAVLPVRIWQDHTNTKSADCVAISWAALPSAYCFLGPSLCCWKETGRMFQRPPPCPSLSLQLFCSRTPRTGENDQWTFLLTRSQCSCLLFSCSYFVFCTESKPQTGEAGIRRGKRQFVWADHTG